MSRVSAAITQARSFEHLLKSKAKSATRRRSVFKNQLTSLVELERIESTLAKCKDLARVANMMIDVAKAEDEPLIYNWIHKKELIPKIFNCLVPRYQNMDGSYTKVYRIPRRKSDGAEMGIIEFIGNDLPVLEKSEEELTQLGLEHLEKLKFRIPSEGTLV